MKVFISYSSQDLKTAESVYRDMVRGGAETFQWNRSAIIGKPSWEQVLDWISESDVFIVLLSRHALASKPVREEIAHAHHSYMNSPKPDKIVSAIIEKAVQPPRLIARFTAVDFLDYDDGLGRLMDQLELKRPTRPTGPKLPASFTLPDLGPVFQEYKKKNPAPSQVEKYSKDAETILANYDALKPASIKDADRAQHLDLILSGLPAAGSKSSRKFAGGALTSLALTDYNKWFLGYEPPSPGAAPPALAESLLSWTPSLLRTPLDAPTLKRELTRLAWTEVAGATGYALEGSATSGFESPREIFRGQATHMSRPLAILTPADGLSHFRVKAVGGAFKPDSAWSNVVSDITISSFSTQLSDPWKLLVAPALAAPTLEVSAGPTPTLRWSKVAGASDYVLERAVTSDFERAQRVYEGSYTSWIDIGVQQWHYMLYYRVKAKGKEPESESPWSASAFWVGGV